MPRIYPRNPQYIPKICPRWAQDIPKVCPRYPQGIPKIYQRKAVLKRDQVQEPLGPQPLFRRSHTFHYSSIFLFGTEYLWSWFLTCYLYFCWRTVAVLEAGKSKETLCRSICLLLEIAIRMGQVISGQEIVFLCPNMMNIKGTSSNC